MKFTIDLHGRLKNFRLPAARALVPVFEGIVNAIHAIDDTTKQAGTIQIELLRGGQPELPLYSQDLSLPIIAFRITDTGIGFTEKNFESFRTSDSQLKARIGGRGVGRLAWLKAFKDVSIDSVYRGTEHKLRRRRFTFGADGISKYSDRAAEKGAKEGTVVLLSQVMEGYADEFPRKLGTVGQRIVDHCLMEIRGASKQLSVSVVDGEESFDVGAAVEQIVSTAQRDEFFLAGKKFTVTHLRVKAPEATAHRLSFLANLREVRHESLSTYLPLLRTRLTDEHGEGFWALALVESETLDDAVSSERDAFVLPEDSGHSRQLWEQLSMNNIRNSVVPLVQARLEPYMSPLRDRAREQVTSYIDHHAPEYRYLLRQKPDEIAALPPDLSLEKLDSESHQVPL